MLRVKNFVERFSQTNIFLESYQTRPTNIPKILDQSVKMQRLGFVLNSNCPSIPNEILQNGAGRNVSGRLSVFLTNTNGRSDQIT